MARRPSTRPWTRLIGALVVTVVAFGAILLGGWSPRLGLDLAGGTTVTLEPKSLEGNKQPSEAALDQAVNIIRQRVDQFGVSESSVVKQSPYLVISVPSSSATRGDVLATVGRTALLSFRVVDGKPLPDPSVLPPQPTPTGTPGPGAPPSGAPGAQTPPAQLQTGAPAPTSAPVAPATAATGRATPNGRPAVDTPSASAVPAPASAPAGAPVETPSPGGGATVAPSAAASPTGAVPAGAAPSGAGAVPSGAVSSGPATPGAEAMIGPLPGGTAAITFDEAQARAAFAQFACGDRRQQQRAADFAPASWAMACGRNGDPEKYLLKPAVVVGTDVGQSQAQPDTISTGQAQVATGAWKVTLQFKNDKYSNLSAQTAGGQIRTAIVLDGVVQSAPTNQQALGRSIEITGGFTQRESQALANVLKFGALPLSFKQKATSQTVSATLGRDSLNAGLLAGAIGLGVVVLYCLLYYRALALVTVLSLGASGALVYAAMVLLGQGIGFTLSLAGIAGLIIGVGVTADSFVVYYERIKDEVRAGRTIRSAVSAAWSPARRTTVSADVVALLAAVILYAVSVGNVRGFALTLGLTTALDLVVFFFVTRPLVELLTRLPFFSSGRFSGLHATGPQAPLRRSTVGRRPVTAGPAAVRTPRPASTAPQEA